MAQQRQQIVIDGPWVVLLRICLVAIPVLGTVFTATAMPWIRWVTDACYRQSSNIDRLTVLESDARTNIQDHSRIMISLEQIKAKLGVDDHEPK
jgi:hypothetical protein